MSHRLKQKIKNSKIYEANWLSLTHNNDQSHKNIWTQKVQQGKHIQEQKQIDRCLIGVVKQKLFGQLLAQDTRISVQGFYTLDRINKQLIHPLKNKNIRRISPLKNQPLYQLGTRSRIQHKTIDNSDVRRITKSLINNYDILQPQELTSSKKVSRNSNDNNRAKKILFVPRTFSVTKITNLPNHFRQLVNNQTSMMYDLKITKQLLIKHNKQSPIVSQRCLDRFLYFFNFTGPLNYKQYCTWIESSASCTNNEASFFVFQLLDESTKGYLTLSNLFKALQDFPLTNSSLLEKQIFQIKEKIAQVTSSSYQNNELTEAVQQIIIKNSSLKIQQMRELLKQSSKQLINTTCIKTTTYHQSMYALEHNPSVRQKKYQLEFSEHSQNSKDREYNDRTKLKGLKFTQFAQLFSVKKSQFFLLTLKLFLGQDPSLIQ